MLSLVRWDVGISHHRGQRPPGRAAKDGRGRPGPAGL